MGTWGSSFFENDAAVAWLGGLSVAGLEREIDGALNRALAPGPNCQLNPHDCSIALAAAELVAAALGRVVDSLPARAATLQGHLSKAGLTGLLTKARAAVDRIASRSDLRDLWEGSGHLDVWLHQVGNLRLRLCS